MANSRKPAPGDSAGTLTAHVEAALARHCRAAPRLCLGYSGGLDSTVLLHLLVAVRERRPIELRALHVHHGLRPHADDWAEHCRAEAARLRVPCDVVRVRIDPDDPHGTEAAARAQRYAAFARQAVDHVVLAQHRDDQAETVLLQLLRGAGVKGCAAMAAEGPLPRPVEAGSVRPSAGPRLLRPLIDIARADLERYARDSALAWVEDDSNADLAYARNAIRHMGLPALAGPFPHAAATLARAAGQFAEAAELLDALARIDSGGEFAEALPVARLVPLPPARRRNLLRAFIAAAGAPLPGSDRLDEMLRQALFAAPESCVRIEFAGFVLHRYRAAVYVRRDVPVVPVEPRSWHGEERIDLGATGGVLHMRPSHGAGLARGRLAAGAVTVRSRSGGERLRTGTDGHSRSLKNLLQEHGVPPWVRAGLPLLWSGNELVWVAGIGAAAGFLARDDEAAVAPEWEPPGGFPPVPGIAVY